MRTFFYQAIAPQKNIEELNEEFITTANTHNVNYAEERQAVNISRASHARFYRTLPAPAIKKESTQEAMLRASSSNF